MDPLIGSTGAPPQNNEAEASLLGALLIDSEAIVKIADTVDASDFYDKKHERIYEAMLKLYEGHRALDVLTLADQLKNNGYLDIVGGPAYLTELTNFVPTASHVEQYADIVSQKAMRRKLIAASKEITGMGYDETKQLRELIEDAETRLFNVSQQHIKQDVISIEAVLSESFDRLDDLHKDKKKIRGIPTGFKDLDNVLAGFQRSDLIILAARPSMGKAQPLDANILTVTGWKKMADLKIGDRLASTDGKESEVNGVFPQGKKQIFKLTFSDGRYTEATADHLWKVKYRDWDESRILTTNELIEKLKYKRYQNRLSIELFTGDYGHREHLPISPWVLGLLISEGEFSSMRFSTASEFVLNRMSTELGDDFRFSRAGKYDYRIAMASARKNATGSRALINTLREDLKELGLWGKHSFDKFIPDVYKHTSKIARIELLRGLLDGDGWAEQHGSVRFATSSKQLAIDVVDLVRSIGGWATVHSKQPYYTYLNERKPGLKSYVVNICHIESEMLFSLPEKIDLAKKQTKTRFKRPNLLSIEPTRIDEAQCISVSHPSHLYITDNYIVTHNTALQLNLAHNVAVQSNEPVLIFSLEMSKEQLVDRLLSMDSGVDAWALRTGNLTDADFEKIAQSMGRLSEAPIFIDDTAGISISDVRTKARREAHRHPLGLIVVDYLQLMSSGTRYGGAINVVQEVSEISKGLKGIARELNVPVLALSQLSRSVESRSPQIPQLADLRDSGSIEQDADVVMFIYREEYYNPETERKKIADIMIKKHRNGPTDNVELRFENEKQLFSSVDRRHQNPFAD
jgi:replicative DNA helicase